MSSEQKSTEQEAIGCAGNGCPNSGISRLTVVYLNKIGWFCESCKNDLVEEGLVLEIGTSGTLPERQMHPTNQSS